MPNIEKGIEYFEKNTVTYKQLKPLLLLSKRNFEDGRNIKLWCVARYIKGVFGIDALKEKIIKYNSLAFEDPLSEKEINQTILKSLQKK